MLAPPLSPVPSINIQLCAEQPPVKEPSSPFDKIEFTMANNNNNNSLESYRSQHLLPPPIHSPKERQVVAKPTIVAGGRGLDAARFEALRNASRQSALHVVRQDLRKEVALRAHQSKQIERRNLFLSKIEALPSPTAASLPVTPPESPAIFHFSLPSPGLISPLALFETLDIDRDGKEQRPVRVEQVDFRARARKEAEALAAVTGNMKQSLQVHGLAPETVRTQQQHPPKPQPQPQQKQKQTATGKTSRNQLPSLDQISARLGGNVTITRSTSPVSRLPAFLQRTSSPPTGNTQLSDQDPVVATPARSITPPTTIGTTTTTTTTAFAAPTPKYTFMPTNSHGPIARPSSSGAVSKHPSTRLPLCPTSVSLPGPRIASTRAPTPLTAEALNALADRAERGCAMMERLQRRFSAPARLAGGNAQPNVRSLARPVGGF
ncbi:hypothetical protein CPB86DRAFT_793734 [Serendipita vermifera]|nr:hypothetical protein CPB86DRAFT_793734 [Serendipita vermifera]